MGGQYRANPLNLADGAVLENTNIDSGGALATDAGKAAYVLAKAVYAASTGATTGPMRGGDYTWLAEADTWNGASAKLQRKKANGQWTDIAGIAALTADGHIEMGIGQGTEVRLVVTGTPSNLFSNIAGI